MWVCLGINNKIGFRWEKIWEIQEDNFEEIRGQSAKISWYQALGSQAQASRWIFLPEEIALGQPGIVPVPFFSAASAGILAVPQSVLGNLAANLNSIPCYCPLAFWTGSAVCQHLEQTSLGWHPILFLKHALEAPPCLEGLQLLSGSPRALAWLTS